MAGFAGKAQMQAQMQAQRLERSAKRQDTGEERLAHEVFFAEEELQREKQRIKNLEEEIQRLKIEKDLHGPSAGAKGRASPRKRVEPSRGRMQISKMAVADKRYLDQHRAREKREAKRKIMPDTPKGFGSGSSRNYIIGISGANGAVTSHSHPDCAPESIVMHADRNSPVRTVHSVRRRSEAARRLENERRRHRTQLTQLKDSLREKEAALDEILRSMITLGMSKAAATQKLLELLHSVDMRGLGNLPDAQKIFAELELKAMHVAKSLDIDLREKHRLSPFALEFFGKGARALTEEVLLTEEAAEKASSTSPQRQKDGHPVARPVSLIELAETEVEFMDDENSSREHQRDFRPTVAVKTASSTAAFRDGYDYGIGADHHEVPKKNEFKSLPKSISVPGTKFLDSGTAVNAIALGADVHRRPCAAFRGHRGEMLEFLMHIYCRGKSSLSFCRFSLLCRDSNLFDNSFTWFSAELVYARAVDAQQNGSMMWPSLQTSRSAGVEFVDFPFGGGRVCADFPLGGGRVCGLPVRLGPSLCRLPARWGPSLWTSRSAGAEFVDPRAVLSCKPFLQTLFANPFANPVVQFYYLFFFFAEGCRQDAPKTPQEAPRRPQDVQNPPKMEPSWHQNRFKNLSYLKKAFENLILAGIF